MLAGEVLRCREHIGRLEGDSRAPSEDGWA